MLEICFLASCILAVTGWVILLLSPLAPKWSDRIAGYVIPITLSLIYGLLFVLLHQRGGYTFVGLINDITLFSRADKALAGLTHYLAIDLFIGAWMCRNARSAGLVFWRVIPCLILTFMFAPLGLIAFMILHIVSTRASTARSELAD